MNKPFGFSVTVVVFLFSIFFPFISKSEPQQDVYVTFISDPEGAQLFIEDVLQGKTPVMVILKTGRYKVKLFHQESLPFEQNIFITEGEAKRKFSFNLSGKKGFLSITGTPEGLPVYIDGKLAGKIPIKTLELSTGTHFLEMVDEKYFELRKEIEIPDGKSVEIYIEGILKEGSKLMPEIDQKIHAEPVPEIPEKPLISGSPEKEANELDIFQPDTSNNFFLYANLRYAVNPGFSQLLEFDFFQFSFLPKGFPFHFYLNMVSIGSNPSKLQSNLFGALDLGINKIFKNFSFLAATKPINFTSTKDSNLKRHYIYSPAFLFAVNFMVSPVSLGFDAEKEANRIYFQLFYLNFPFKSEFGNNFFGISFGTGLLIPAKTD